MLKGRELGIVPLTMLLYPLLPCLITAHPVLLPSGLGGLQQKADKDTRWGGEELPLGFQSPPGKPPGSVLIEQPPSRKDKGTS